MEETQNDETKNTGGIDQTAQQRLSSFIARIERLEEEKAGIASDIKDVYAEAKGAGFDPKIMKQIVRLRKMKAEDRAEAQMLLDTYMAALGMAVESA